MIPQCPILIVDDDENDLYLLERALQTAGIEHPLQFARNGEDAVQQLTEAVKGAQTTGARLPRLMILDLKMPLRTGLDVLRWLRRQPVLRTLPVIMFSSSAHRHDIERAYLLGVNAFVVKPASTVQRAEFARNVKSFWLEFAEPPLICREGLAAAQRLHATNAWAEPTI
jgi:CheY-like chemotaxis protein